MAKIFPLGESVLTIEFSNEISPETNDKVVSLSKFFEVDRFPGFVEIVPAYSSLTIYYDVLTVRKNFPESSTAFDAVKNIAETALLNLAWTKKEKSRVIEIPVNFTDENALDLEVVAEINGLEPPEVIEIFTAQIYRVYMLGFLPGFAYLGEIDVRIAAPRKDSPRLMVPKGSVGIAGGQTGIYPLASPGGWQIIGKTAVEMFTPNAEKPTFLQTGDLVKFYCEN